MEAIRIAIILGLMYLTSQILILLYNYIQCLIKSEKIKIEKREKYFGLVFLIVLIIGLSYLQKKDVFLGLQIGLFLTLFWLLFVHLIKLIVFMPKLFSKKHQRIDGLNNTGFKIAKGTSLKQYYWRDIQWINFDKEKFSLILKEKRRLEIDKRTQNFYLLLKSIPLGYKDFDYDYINSYFSSLTTCIVCGSIAFRESKCLSCCCTSWTKELEKDYSNYDEYVKENQLEIFATMEKKEKFSEFKIVDKNFVFDSNWQPLVTKKEVLEYSEKEYWGNE